MSGSGPVRAAGLGVPTPRSAPAKQGDGSAPGDSRTPSGSSAPVVDIPTEAHAALLDPDDPGAGVDTGEILALLGGPAAAEPDHAPDSVPAGDVGPSDDASAERRPPSVDDTPTWPDVEITRTHAVWFWLWGPLLAAVLVVSFLAGMASAPVTLPSPTAVHPATLLDVRGRLLADVDPPAGAEQVPAEQLPDLLLRAIVAVQDPGYFDRSGLSATDLVKAGGADLVRVHRHGTTIEERYANQVRVAAGSRVPSLRESTVAARLAQKLSRRALLIRYVDGMYFGNGVYGVSAAARFYFGSSVTGLDAAQIAMLAGIADDPSRQNPVVAPALAIGAQQRAVRTMQDAGLLTPQQADAALREPIDARAHRQLERSSPAPDFTALVQSSLLSRFGDDLVYGQGLRVVTPLDLDLQTALGDTVRHQVPTNVPGVLALATDPRTGDIRAMLNRSASSSASGPEGAADILFTRRPLGTLAGALPIPAGDGHSASLGEVTATVGAVATDGVRHDLRPLTSVTRPAIGALPPETLDQADPLPPGQPVLVADRAGTATAALRESARRPGAPAAALPFALTAVSSADGPAAPTSGPSWYVGCVPELCLTVWTGSAPGRADDAGGLAGSIVATTLQRYIAVAPDRLTLPQLSHPRGTERSTPPPTQRVEAPAPRPTASVSAAPTPVASLQPSGAAQPSAAPTAADPDPAKPSASPSPDTGTGAAGPGEGTPAAQGAPGTGGDADAGT